MNGFNINKTKCLFAKSKSDFLCHTIGIDGIDVLSEKIQAIHDLPFLVTRKDLRFIGLYMTFIGLFYRTGKLLPHISLEDSRNNSAT